MLPESQNVSNETSPTNVSNKTSPTNDKQTENNENKTNRWKSGKATELS